MYEIKTDTLVSWILTEDEWYSVPRTQQELVIETLRSRAEENEARYASIFVEPNAVMSVSPVEGRHRVWHHTFPASDEDAFCNAISDAYAKSPLTAARKRFLLRSMYS